MTQIAYEKIGFFKQSYLFISNHFYLRSFFTKKKSRRNFRLQVHYYKKIKTGKSIPALIFRILYPPKTTG